MDTITRTFRRLEERYGEIEYAIDLPPVVRTFVLIHAAQGVIDNGGWRFFFGSDWPGTPPYKLFIDAYKTIGCEVQAKEMERVVSTFPFDNPHLHEAKRLAYMKANHLPATEWEISGWGDRLCGDGEVWEKLEKYCKEHEELA